MTCYSGSEGDLRLNLPAGAVQSFRDVECGNDVRNDQEGGHFSEVSTWADPAAKSENVFAWI